MKPRIRKPDIASFLFSATIAAFLAFFLYMWTSESVSVYRSEQTRGYEVVTGVQTELVSDDTAPVGIRKVFRWVLAPEDVKGSSLLFNIAHHHIEVYFDDTLVYALTGREDNRIGGNVGSNWCSVYAGPECTGQTVTVVLTPLFEAALGKNPELPVHFALGAALSAEHPGISRTELFRLADEEMYQNKQLWYRQKQTNS